MLKFVSAAEVAASQDIDLTQPADSRLSGAELGSLTMMVLNRFIQQVEWDDVASIYLTGLADNDDLALVQRAVKALIAGGVEFAAPAP